MQLHDAVRKLLYTQQAQPDLAMPRRQQRNPFSDEGRYDGEDELVDRALVEKRRDDAAAPQENT